VKLQMVLAYDAPSTGASPFTDSSMASPIGIASHVAIADIVCRTLSMARRMHAACKCTCHHLLGGLGSELMRVVASVHGRARASEVALLRRWAEPVKSGEHGVHECRLHAAMTLVVVGRSSKEGHGQGGEDRDARHCRVQGRE